jgi:hypothetical protein
MRKGKVSRIEDGGSRIEKEHVARPPALDPSPYNEGVEWSTPNP